MTQSTNEAQIRMLVESWAKAVRAKDMDSVLANHTDDIVMFDVPMPLQAKGMRKENRQWLIAHEHHSYPIKLESGQ